MTMQTTVIHYRLFDVPRIMVIKQLSSGKSRVDTWSGYPHGSYNAGNGEANYPVPAIRLEIEIRSTRVTVWNAYPKWHAYNIAHWVRR